MKQVICCEDSKFNKLSENIQVIQYNPLCFWLLSEVVAEPGHMWHAPLLGQFRPMPMSIFALESPDLDEKYGRLLSLK